MSILTDQVLLLVTTPLYVAVIALEWGLAARQGRNTYALADTATNVYLTALNTGLDAVMAGVTLAFLSWFYGYRLFPVAPAGVPYWFALFLLQDFAYYVLHYVDHHCRFFWATHVTHHSSLHFNFSTGFRASVFQPFYRMFYFAPLALAGFRPADILVMYAVMQIVGTFVHNDRCGKLGPLEWVFVTPSHHRVHHASNPRYLDKNIGMTLIVWDRLFGTFAAEDPREPVRYGITRPVNDRGPVNILLHEWRDMGRDLRGARNWGERFRYVLGPPGWAPPDSPQSPAPSRIAGTPVK